MEWEIQINTWKEYYFVFDPLDHVHKLKYASLSKDNPNIRHNCQNDSEKLPKPIGELQ